MSSSALPPDITRNPGNPSLFHLDRDNFDQNTAGGYIHTCHGIMLQEVGDLKQTDENSSAEASKLVARIGPPIIFKDKMRYIAVSMLNGGNTIDILTMTNVTT